MQHISPKEEWVRYGGLSYFLVDRWLRDQIAALFALEEPSGRQQRLLRMGSHWLTSLDLPPGAFPTLEALEGLGSGRVRAPAPMAENLGFPVLKRRSAR